MKKILILFFSIINLFILSDKACCVTDVKDNTELSVEDCIEIALKNDPNITLYTNVRDAMKSRVGQAKSDYFPQLLGNTSYNLQNNNYSMNNVTNNYYQLNLGVNQLIWNFGKTTAKINMQKYNYAAADFDLENTVLNTVYKVKLAYFGVLAAKANHDIYERSVRINGINYERTKALYEEGLKSKIDVVNAEVYLTDAKIQLLDADNKYQTALIALNNAMYYRKAPAYTIKNTENFNFQKNYSVKNEINVAYIKKQQLDEKADNAEQSAILTSGIEKQNILENFVFKPFEMSMDECIDSAYEKRPDLKSLLLAQKAANESLKAVKRMYLPDINATYGYTFRKVEDKNNSGFTVAGALAFPNINIMNVKYSIAEAKSNYKIAGDNIDIIRNTIYFDIQNYYVNMIQLEKRIPLMGKKVKQTLENFELADGRYTVGLGNFIELQDAQTNYNNAQLAYVQSVFDYNVAKVQLERAMGIR